ncbi:esterase-like activity of phytase family protein [Erythrobacter sp.]|uniref:esterase-like activity of phytase family protein n=1 Tax=Erythrobacter sp. TaxID=1042 RepID=UPI0025EE20BF|nr:esterase-like activity of phytase family protein [Erythrobacter sp.]
MARGKRLLAAGGIALLCAPGTWLRSEIVTTPPRDIAVEQVQDAGPADQTGWQVAGVWHYRAGGLRFGGFSALLALGPGKLRAFSDRGYRITLTEPDGPAPTQGMNRQQVERGAENDLLDAESATRDPGSGAYWIGYEQVHTIQRNTIASYPDGLRDLRPIVDWAENGGAEAMVRLADGQFVLLPECCDRGLIFPGDPVAGGMPAEFRFVAPAPDYVATDITQLPDGRLLVLMRRLVRPSPDAWPPFSTLLVIGEAPEEGGTFAPETTLRLDPVIPRENYEGLAVRPRTDGRVDVWLIADDNFSVIQRTLLVKLVFDPKA